MAPRKAPSREMNWLDSPIANRHIAAFTLGLAFNGCRFHLRQAFLLYGGIVDGGAAYEFNKAVKILDVMIKKDSEFAGKKWAKFEDALRSIRAKWTQLFGELGHRKFLEQLENEMENCDEFLRVHEEPGAIIAEYDETLQQRDWDWKKHILRDCHLWLDELRATLLGEQSGVGRDLAAQEFQLQVAVKTDAQILILAVTHWVPHSAWHELAEDPHFSRVWRKSHANAQEPIWEIRVNCSCLCQNPATPLVTNAC